jgi:hypothetical protein
MARETRALPGGAAARMGRWSRFGPRGPLVSVGTVSHRPFPGLPGEAGMARETRALPGGQRPGWAGGGDSGQEARWFW